ncbi:MAG: sirohydrochlorin nickelochelatase [Methanobacteriaceae archaeon]|jgi:sirohydrochlorin cobaltochelatase|nr:sirohydrochlorin nickelochelatase [Candidatus Methanorudis spinitermitis]
MDSNSKSQNKIAVLLVSHGSSLPYAQETFDEISNLFKEATGYITEVGYMKVAEPSLAKAIDNILIQDENIEKIIAMPVFLSFGIHTNIDIPIILGLNPKETDPRCPDGNYPEDHYLNGLEQVNFKEKIELLNPIGPDPLIIEIIEKRISSVLKKSKIDTDPDKTGVLIISHGSRLNYNREFIKSVFNQYKQNSDYIVGQGFMELMEPTIPQAVSEMIENNDLDRLIAVPVFIAPGVHTTRDIPTILGLLDDDSANSHSHNHHDSSSHAHGDSHGHHHHHNEKIDFDGEVLYTDPLGADSLIIEIIKERVENEIKKS